MGTPHNTKEFKLMRAVVIWLHSFRCFQCKKSFSTLQVHHINEVNTDNEIINLVPLCARCHSFWHRVPRQKALSYKFIVVLLLGKIEFFTKK